MGNDKWKNELFKILEEAKATCAVGSPGCGALGNQYGQKAYPLAGLQVWFSPPSRPKALHTEQAVCGAERSFPLWRQEPFQCPSPADLNHSESQESARPSLGDLIIFSLLNFHN